MQSGTAGLLLNGVFYFLALAAVGASLGVLLSRNIVRTAFCLLGVLFSVAGLYALMKADFVFAVQVLVYVGGILVLIIFAIMLTHRIVDVNMSNPAMVTLPAVLVGLLVLFCLVVVAVAYPGVWAGVEGPAAVPDVPLTRQVGEAMMNEYLYPFEILSVLLLAALIGAAYLARKEVRS